MGMLMLMVLRVFPEPIACARGKRTVSTCHKRGPVANVTRGVAGRFRPRRRRVRLSAESSFEPRCPSSWRSRRTRRGHLPLRQAGETAAVADPPP